MDKKIFFKRIAATVSAVAVFALSFSVFRSSDCISVSAATIEEDCILSPFADLTLASTTPNYTTYFDFPDTLLNSVNPIYNISGNYISDYVYQNSSNFGTYIDSISGTSRVLEYRFTSYFPTSFSFIGHDFFYSQRYLDLLLGSNLSGFSSSPNGLLFHYNRPIPDDVPVELFFKFTLILKDSTGSLTTVFDGSDIYYIDYIDDLYSLKTAKRVRDGFPLLDSLYNLTLDRFFYFSDDVYYYVDTFDISFIGAYSSNYKDLSFFFADNSLDTFALIDNYKVSLTSYFDVISSNSVSSDYFDEKILESFLDGKEIGYNTGYVEGSSLAQGDFDIFGTIVSAIADFLSFEILPNFTLGTLFLISFGAAFLFFVIKIFLGG